METKTLTKFDEKVVSEICSLFNRAVGETINSVRKEKGYSLRDLYKMTGVSIAVMSDLEKGSKLPRIESIIRIAYVLGIPVSLMFSNFNSAYDNNLSDAASKEEKHAPIEQLKSALLGYELNKDDINSVVQFVEFLRSKRTK